MKKELRNTAIITLYLPVSFTMEWWSELWIYTHSNMLCLVQVSAITCLDWVEVMTEDWRKWSKSEMKVYGIQWSQTWLHFRILEKTQNYFICHYACKWSRFSAKLAGCQGRPCQQLTWEPTQESWIGQHRVSRHSLCYKGHSFLKAHRGRRMEGESRRGSDIVAEA